MAVATVCSAGRAFFVIARAFVSRQRRAASHSEAVNCCFNRTRKQSTTMIIFHPRWVIEREACSEFDPIQGKSPRQKSANDALSLFRTADFLNFTFAFMDCGPGKRGTNPQGTPARIWPFLSEFSPSDTQRRRLGSIPFHQQSATLIEMFPSFHLFFFRTRERSGIPAFVAAESHPCRVKYCASHHIKTVWSYFWLIYPRCGTERAGYARPGEILVLSSRAPLQHKKQLRRQISIVTMSIRSYFSFPAMKLAPSLGSPSACCLADFACSARFPPSILPVIRVVPAARAPPTLFIACLDRDP